MALRPRLGGAWLAPWVGYRPPRPPLSSLRALGASLRGGARCANALPRCAPPDPPCGRVAIALTRLEGSPPLAGSPLARLRGWRAKRAHIFDWRWSLFAKDTKNELQR